MYCRNCGAEIADDANFCPKCGVRTEKAAKEGVATPYEAHWRQDVDAALQQASKAIDEGVRVARDSLREVAKDIDKEFKMHRESEKLFCKNCGAENQRGAKFCVKCGKPL